MKTCPQCSTGYPDSLATCPIHGLLLNEIRELRPGMVIHKTYRIVRKLGQGGMGTVYLAQHIHMGEQRALKFLSGELSHDEAFTARFLREVRTLRQVHSRNVVECGDLEAAEDDSLFFSMEFVDGPDLRRFLHDAHKPFDVSLALNIARQIAEGLGAAHAKGMVHRDIKPENILMARDGDCWLPKIADFGIVATKESSTAYTRTGGTLLTMAYAAPEQWRGTPAAELDGRTDLYALGGLLYEMLTGQTPFHSENYESWARQHQTTPPQPPSTLRTALANWQGLDAITLCLLAKDRNDRPANVPELLSLLDAVRYELPTPQPHVTRPVTVTEPPTPLPEPPLLTPELVPTTSRSAISKWAVASILIVITVGIWAAVRFSRSTAPVSTEGNQTAAQPSAFSTPTVIKPSKPASIPTPSPGGGTSPSAQSGTIPNPTPTTTTLLVMCDLACDWTLDGKPMGRIYSGGSAKPVVEPGQHLVVAATDDGADQANQIIEVKAGRQTIVRIVLQPVRDARLKVEQEAREKAELEAKNKAAREQAARDEAARLQDLRDHAAERLKEGESLYDQKHYKEARPLFEKACDGGVMEGCSELGWLYASGQGVPLDYEQARLFFKKACDGGAMKGCDNLGGLYENGYGVPQNYILARTLYTKACDGGDMWGCNMLGFLYANGSGVSQDYGRARILYEKACSGGDINGCQNLGVLYANGYGVPRDYRRARMLLEKACVGELVDSCSTLGELYENGLGVSRNYAQARAFYEKACDGGEMLGCNQLGLMFANGIGVPRDYARARTLWNKACNGGFDQACKNLHNLP